MSNWYMLTVVGVDRPGIVAEVTRALYEGNCDLGEASMLRLGGNFTIMLMVRFPGSVKQLDKLVSPVTGSLRLRHHVDNIEARLHQHVDPDVRITVTGADRAGIVAQATGALAEAGLDILNLESDVAGTKEQPIYIMQIEGRALEGLEPLESAVDIIRRQKIDVTLTQIEIVVG